MFQVSYLKGQHFCEFSANKLRELQSVYQNTGNTHDPDSNGHFFVTPKLQKLLSVLKEDRNSNCGENELQLPNFLFIFLIIHVNDVYFCNFEIF